MRATVPRDPSSSAEVVKRLNPGWWETGTPARTNRAFCEAVAFVDDELADILATAVAEAAQWCGGAAVAWNGTPLSLLQGLVAAPPRLMAAAAVQGGDCVWSPRLSAQVHSGPAVAAHPGRVWDLKTHTSPHHHDDVLATVLCLHAEACRAALPVWGAPVRQSVARARSREVRAKWTVDVDGAYDPAARQFDHHQHGEQLAGHSAASLVWAHWAEPVCDRWCRSCGLSGSGPEWAALVGAVAGYASAYVTYARCVDNNTLRYVPAAPPADHRAVSDAVTAELLAAYVGARFPQLGPAQAARVAQGLTAGLRRVQAVEEERVMALAGGAVLPMDFGVVGRHARNPARPLDFLGSLSAQLVQDELRMEEAAAVVKEAFEARAGRRFLVLSRGVKDMERLVLAHAEGQDVQYVAWPHEDGYTLKGVRGALFPAWWWDRARMGKAVRYKVKPEPGMDPELCALVGVPDVKFVHKAGWIAGARTLRSAERMMAQSVLRGVEREREREEIGSVMIVS